MKYQGKILFISLLTINFVLKSAFCPLTAMFTDAINQHNAGEVIRLLGQGKVKINKPDQAGKTPLQIAASNGDDYMVNLLIERGASINFASVLGTALTVAAANNQLSTVQLLINRGANINKGNKRCESTPILKAIECGHIVIIEELLKHDMSLLASDKDGVLLSQKTTNQEIKKILQEKEALFASQNSQLSAQTLKRQREDTDSCTPGISQLPDSVKTSLL